MPSKRWSKQNGPPARMAPDGVVTGPQVWNPLPLLRPMNMYSPLTLQLWANAHSSPPPTVHVVTVLLPEVEISQLPHPAGVLARIEDRSLSWNESGAALDVEQPAVPGVSQSASYHAVPIADLRAPQHVKDRLRADDGTGIKGVATQTHVAGFAFKAEHEGRVDRLQLQPSVPPPMKLLLRSAFHE